MRVKSTREPENISIITTTQKIHNPQTYIHTSNIYHTYLEPPTNGPSKPHPSIIPQQPYHNTNTPPTPDTAAETTIQAENPMDCIILQLPPRAWKLL